MIKNGLEIMPVGAGHKSARAFQVERFSRAKALRLPNANYLFAGTILIGTGRFRRTALFGLLPVLSALGIAGLAGVRGLLGWIGLLRRTAALIRLIRLLGIIHVVLVICIVCHGISP